MPRGGRLSLSPRRLRRSQLPARMVTVWAFDRTVRSFVAAFHPSLPPGADLGME